MPTAAKLFGAILMAGLGYLVAGLIVPHLPQELPEGHLRVLSAFLGILVGWRFLGSRVGGGLRSAMGLGLSASATLVFCGLVLFSGNEMIKRSLRKAYVGPVEALKDMVQIIIDDLVYLRPPEVLATLIVGGMVVGLLTELVSRRWS